MARFGRRAHALVGQVEELQARLAALESERTEPVTADESSTDVSRRRLFRTAGAAAVGGVAAAVLGADVAGAAAGDNLVIGSNTNDSGTSQTHLTADAFNLAFLVTNNGNGHAIVGATDATGAMGPGAGVRGQANATTGTVFGVDGYTASSGAGTAGVRGNATSIAGRTYGVQGTTASGSVNAAGVNGEATNTVGATFGVLGTTASTTNNATGVAGNADGATGVTFGVRGTNASATNNAVAVRADANGVSGTTYGVRALNASTSGIGVLGHAGAASGSTIGVSGLASASAAGLGVRAEGGLAPILLVPKVTPGAPGAGTHAAGELVVDSAGSIFVCKTGGTPGTWAQLNDQFGGSGSGITVLAAPSRVFDSRTGQPNPSGSPQGTFAFGAAARTINCSPAVPGGATAILCNLTATGTAGAGAGALLIWAAGATEPLSSSINWSGPGQTLANGVTSACNGSQDVQIKCVASAGSSAHVILDVIGYYA